MQKNHPLHINIPITKVDEEQRMVWGYATVEELDAHGEIVGYEASKKAFPNWLGNIREMHGPVAIGKRIEVNFDDANKGIWLGSYISESADGENAWTKVKEGILQAYSIGGNINDFKMVKLNGSDHVMVTDYDLYEVSLVDNPACPSAMLQVVKSLDGHLTYTEKLAKGIGRPVAWWETQYHFSESQKVINPSFMLYNKNSMPKQSNTLAKDIFSADALIDLGVCLADFIWMQAWEGTDTSDLQAALESIKTAAATELGEDETFPEPVMMAVEEACRALNITKVEELDQMIKSKPVIEKAGVAAVDSDPRNASAATVAEVTAGAPIKPASIAVPKKVYAADGKTTTSKSADDPDAADPGTPITVNKPGDVVPPVDDPAADPVADPVVDPPADDAEVTDPPADPADSVENAASAGDLNKVTDQSDLTKSILEGVGALIQKEVAPLKEEIERLKASPAPSKRAATFTDVERINSDTQKTAFDTNKTRFDELMVKANDFAAHPEKGTTQDRVKIGIELRKLARAMDPASVAQIAAIKASFITG